MVNDKSNSSLDFSPIAKLIQIGRKKSYATITDIIKFFPDAEENIEQLEKTFSALISSGIPYVEDIEFLSQPSDNDLEKELVDGDSEDEDEQHSPNDLANIDTNDTIGLYLREVSRVPLWNAQEEVDLAQRIESGRMTREELEGEMSLQDDGLNLDV